MLITKDRILGALLLLSSVEARAISEDAATSMSASLSLGSSTHVRFSGIPVISSVASVSPSGGVDAKEAFVASLNARIDAQKLSDHTIERHVVDGIPIYTWNVWAFGSPGAFMTGMTTLNKSGLPEETDPVAYEAGRFTPEVQIVKDIFTEESNAIVCLQEFTNENTDKYHKQLGRALNASGVTFQYNKMNGSTKVGSGNFGLISLYKKDEYDVVDLKESLGGAYSSLAAKPFQGLIPPSNDASGKPIPQAHRVLKVVFKPKRGGGAPVSIVNAHLAWGDPQFKQLADSLITYSQEQGGDLTVTPIGVITGDFNYDLNGYASSDPRVTVIPVGKSYAWDKAAGATSPAKITDGFIIVRP